MKIAVSTILALLVLPVGSLATEAPGGWRAEIISLISHQQFEEAGEKIKEQCIHKGNGALCLTMASAHYNGEAQLGIESRDFVEAAKYARLSCDLGTQDGCLAYKAAMEGELLQNVLFEQGIDNRGEQLEKAIKLGVDLNATPMFTRTVLQEAISEENIQAVGLLLDYGADVNYRVSEEDLTPLMYAVNSGNTKIVRLLLENGADPAPTMKVPEYLETEKEETNACDLAGGLENREMRALLNCTDT